MTSYIETLGVGHLFSVDGGWTSKAPETSTVSGVCIVTEMAENVDALWGGHTNLEYKYQ